MNNSLKEKGQIVLIVIVILAALYGISWLLTCGIIKLITLCFGLTFKWSTATGIWLIMCLLKPIFTNHNSDK